MAKVASNLECCFFPSLLRDDHCPLSNYVCIYLHTIHQQHIILFWRLHKNMNGTTVFHTASCMFYSMLQFIWDMSMLTQECLHLHLCVYIWLSPGYSVYFCVWYFMYECTTVCFYLACWYIFSLLPVCCNFQCTSTKISSWDPYINSVICVRQEKWGNSNIREVKWLH